ncbi:SusD family protein [compost metagenome]
MTSKLKNITFALSILLSISSCKKGWLDVNSGTQINSDTQFSSESGFKDALMGVYIGMTDPALYSKDITWGLVDILSHQYRPLTGNEQYVDIYNYNYKTIKATTRIDAVWNKSYNTIANINNALLNIDKNKANLDPINYAIIKGELLGLRAFLHFDLMRLYGYGNIANRPELAGKLAIPYVTDFKKEITPQLSYSQTFDLLSKDINEALALLKEDPIYNNPKKPTSYYLNVNRDGFYNKREQRLNYYAVKALQARILLWQGGNTNVANAALAAEEVIKDSPAKLTNSASVATNPSLYTEHLFNLNVTGFLNIINTYLKANDASITNTLYLTNAQAQSTYETANVNIGLSDFRYNTLLSAQTLGMVPIKYYQSLEAKDVGRNIMPLMKLPEMYYIAAEHYITTNPGKAIEYLDKIRENRGIVQPIPTNSNIEQIKTELDKEYQKELIMDGQLFFYYKRLGKTTYPGLASTIVANDKVYLLPYPATEIEFGNRVQ